jgi:hypothetical protein
MRPRQRQQQLKGRASLPGLQPDSVLTEIPVDSDSWASVVPRSILSARSRGPTASRTSSKEFMLPLWQTNLSKTKTIRDPR